ncbi:MAG: deoxyribonuclease IV [Fidelibacterota bacterium]
MGLLGAHVSVAGGVENAPARGSAIDADTIQIFTANQNQWFPKQPSTENATAFREQMAIERPEICVTHDSYLINLGSPDAKKLNMSRRAFLDEIDRCDACNIPYLIFHPGAHLKTGEEECLKRIAKSINYCLDKRPNSRVNLLIENTAGQGSNVGYRFNHLRDIIDQVTRPKRMGVCIDTQHSFAAGYDLRTETGWNKTFLEFDKVVGLQWIKAFHVNDSKRELGTRVDRHEKIGQGFLTMETFWCLVNDDRFEELPMVLETPVVDESEYADELKLLRNLINVAKPR